MTPVRRARMAHGCDRRYRTTGFTKNSAKGATETGTFAGTIYDGEEGNELRDFPISFPIPLPKRGPGFYVQ